MSLEFNARFALGRGYRGAKWLRGELAAEAPGYTVAIIPRTARALPRYDEFQSAALRAAIDRIIADPSPANVEALRAAGQVGAAESASRVRRRSGRMKPRGRGP